MAHHTDFFVEPDYKIKFNTVGANGTVTIDIGDYMDGVILFFRPDALHKLLELSGVVEQAWSSTLKDAS